MDMLIVGICSFLAAGLTLYSGFGLGTLLMPVFALFFPIQAAVAATAIVHAANNIFKVSAMGRHADRALVIRFGLPAIAAAVIGAMMLTRLPGWGQGFQYSLAGRDAMITPVKLIMAILIFIFALFDLLPALRRLRFDRRYLPLGGLLSGFFGGLSGHQGALRSAFLVKVGVSTQAFVGTNAVIGLLVDMARMTVYFVIPFLTAQKSMWPMNHGRLIATAIFGALIGVILGKRFVEKVTMATVQTLTGLLLLLIALALGSGLI